MDPIRQQRKHIGAVEFKLDADTEGAFRATFSTFNVIDLDGDVTLPGAFESGAKTRISQWGHNWFDPAIGVGTIGQDDVKAWVEGQFNLQMQVGRETYEAVKVLSEAGLQEWSYGYDILEWSIGQFEEREVRFLRKLKCHEVSPVLLGAGIRTMTDWIKHAPDAALVNLLSDSLPLDRHAETVIAAVKGLSDRLGSQSELRIKEGRELSEANRERIREMAESAGTISKGLADLYERTAPEPKGADPAEVLRLLIGFERQVARLHGVSVEVA